MQSYVGRNQGRVAWEESSAELGGQKPAVASTFWGIDQSLSLAVRESCAVVRDRSRAVLCGNEVAKGCAGTKWCRVGWRLSGAQVCGNEVVPSFVRVE